MSFRFVEHTADVCAECIAPDYAGLLTIATQALYAVALEGAGDGADVQRSIELDAYDREEMLVRWLQEMLFLLDVERFVATEVRFRQATGTRVEATVCGYVHGESGRATEVKAATYHNLRIQETPEGLRVSVVFDL